MWFAMLIWFSSSLLSQSAYMAIHGLPYDSVMMFKSLGPVYYALLVFELLMWLTLFSFGWTKVSRSKHGVIVQE